MESKYLLSGQDYLLVSAMPTPNGRLHLGHISGPFLPMDILKRRIIRDGGTVKLVSGSDVYESHTLLKAYKTGEDVNDICFKYHSLIEEDLRLMNLSYDLYINPLSEEHLEDFKKFIQIEFENLLKKGILLEKNENFYFSEKYKDIISGCWIKGNCPSCNTTTGNYQCENCFSFYNPEDILEACSNREDDLLLNKVMSVNYFVKIDKERLMNVLKNSNLNDVQLEIISNFFEKLKGLMRVTSSESWGIPVLKETNGDIPMMAFPYVTMLFYAIYCSRLMDKKDVFAKNSDTIIVNAHGMDNLIPTTAGMIGLGLELDEYKTFDYHIANYFLNLDGSKFSTSRNNAIWVDEIIEREEIESDYVRYFLAKKSPQFSEVNITKKELLDSAKEVSSKFNKAIAKVQNSKYSYNDESVRKDLIEKFLGYLAAQQEALSPEKFNVTESVTVIEKWFDIYESLDENNSFYWLASLTILIDPIMPNLSKHIWNNVLEFDSQVSLPCFFNKFK